jgi:DNA repair photolyase
VIGVINNIDREWKTWNPVKGCLHNCSYCWAKRFALERLSRTEKYKDGFAPKLVEGELNKRFRNQFVFVSDMGDLFGEWVPAEWILRVIDSTRNSPSSDFLFLTKNPSRYEEFTSVCRDNIILGATIESNRLYDFSKAPSVAERAKAMIDLQFSKKFISVEPIMDFDTEKFVEWIERIAPIHVSVGYDNWNNRLPEPPLSKTLQLIERLEKFTEVRRRTLREACTQCQLGQGLVGEQARFHLALSTKKGD